MNDDYPICEDCGCSYTDGDARLCWACLDDEDEDEPCP
jgi:hypothetical protein